MRSIAALWKGRSKQARGRLYKLWGRFTHNQRREFIGDLIIVEGKLETHYARRMLHDGQVAGPKRSLHVVA